MTEKESIELKPEDLHELLRVRLEKLEELKAQGIEPYGGRYPRTHLAAEIKENYAALEGAQVRVAGRLVARRTHGKASFGNIMDGSGQIQVYLRLGDVDPATYSLFLEDLDLGDIIGAGGSVFKTRTGEITVAVRELRLLAKCLRPLPEKWHGLKDVDLRYRQRYLDLIMNPEVKKTFLMRSEIVHTIRNFLDRKGFLEVETPMMQPIPGGATARPFETFHNALNRHLYLRIAPELYLKRLLVGGFERVFERLVDAHGRAGDVAIALSTSGDSPNVLAGVDRARARGLCTLALTGKGGGKLAARVELALVVPSDDTQRIQEAHILLYHALCEMLEVDLFSVR
mgnify:CR=1 FL=1